MFELEHSIMPYSLSGEDSALLSLSGDSSLYSAFCQDATKILTKYLTSQ